MKDTLIAIVLLNVIVFSCASAYALLHPQTAKVIKLTEPDAAQARFLYDTYTGAKTRWDDYQKIIKDRYTKDKDGFEFGFEFSDDFNYIVPSSSQPGPVIYYANPASSLPRSTLRIQ